MNGVQLPLPLEDLKQSGIVLQQAIVLTRIRVEGLKNSRLKVRGVRIVENADKLFQRVSEVAQVSRQLSEYLSRAFSMTLCDLFDIEPENKIATGAAYTGMALLNNTIGHTIDVLAQLNKEIDGVKNEII